MDQGNHGAHHQSKDSKLQLKAQLAALGRREPEELAGKPHYDLAGPGKNELSIVDFGCNPAVKNAGKMESFVAAGTVTLLFGNNTWAGGTNKEPFALSLFLPGTTVTLDGKPLIENGVLK